MGIEKYRVAPGVEEFRSRFEQNLVPRAQFNLKTTEGALVGIPTFDPIRHGTDKFQVHTPDGHVLMIPFADLEAAEDHVASDDRFMDLAISEARRTPPEEGKTVQLFVGAALVLDNEVLGTAYRGERTAGHHAERTLLETKLGDAKRPLCQRE